MIKHVVFTPVLTQEEGTEDEDFVMGDIRKKQQTVVGLPSSKSVHQDNSSQRVSRLKRDDRIFSSTIRNNGFRIVTASIGIQCSDKEFEEDNIERKEGLSETQEDVSGEDSGSSN